jgi:hypothetical protein
MEKTFGWVRTLVIALVRPPLNGPIGRHRISANAFHSPVAHTAALATRCRQSEPSPAKRADILLFASMKISEGRKSA